MTEKTFNSNMFVKFSIVLCVTLALFFTTSSQTVLAGERLKLSTTTSTENTGLLGYLLPAFEKETGIKVDVIPLGTGRALKLAENGDVDVTMVHAPAKEIAFVEAGFGVNRRIVMANYFMIVGHAADPAAISKASSAREAFQLIAKGKHTFISRGDNSGTHAKEEDIWKAAEISPAGAWYVESGRGMGETLTMADEKMGYTLSDAGTFLKYESKVDLKALYAKKDENLFNPYAVIAVNPARWPGINYSGAMKFITWITSPPIQKMIGEFKDSKGRVLFSPLAVPSI